MEERVKEGDLFRIKKNTARQIVEAHRAASVGLFVYAGEGPTTTPASMGDMPG